MSCQVRLTWLYVCTALYWTLVQSADCMYMACRLLPRVPYLWGFKAPDCMHADCCQVYRVYACTLTVDYCHLYSTAVVLIFSWCIEKEEVLKRQMLILPALVRTLISHPEKKRLSVSLIIIVDVSPFLIWKDIVSLHFQKLLGAL